MRCYQPVREMYIVGKVYICFSKWSSLLIGVTLGIALSLIAMPFVEDNCVLYERESVQKSQEDYDPIINLLIRPPHRHKPRLVRPRYYSSELGIRDKLLVAILASPSPSVENLLLAANRTLSYHADKLVYFLSTKEPITNLPTVIGFEDTDSRLPFHAVQYLNNNYINEYDYFFIAKFTTYINGAVLRRFVDHLSVNRDVYVGYRPNGSKSAYCDLDAGILLSNSVLEKIVGNLGWCIDNMVPESDSRNFADCIHHGSGLNCSVDVQGREFFAYKMQLDTDLPWKIGGRSFQSEICTIFPLSTPFLYYKMHYYFSKKEITKCKNDIHSFQKRMLDMSGFLPEGNNSISWPIDIESSYKATTRFDVIHWTFFNSTHLFLPNEITVQSKIYGANKVDMEQIQNICNEWIYQNCHSCVFSKLVNGYRRFDPTRGMEYIIDLVFKNIETGQNTMKRLQIVRPLSKVEMISVPFVTEHTRIVFVLILQSNSQKGAVKFLQNYAKSCLDKQDNTVLLFVLLYNPKDPGKGNNNDAFGNLKGLVNSYTSRYRSTGAKIAWLSIRTAGRLPPEFSIFDLVARKLPSETIVLRCQLGMEIHSEYLNRVRMNTILKTQVFMPVPFVQYHPTITYQNNRVPEYVEVKKDYGHFDLYNFDHMSFYIHDYLMARKAVEKEIPIIRSDRDLLNEHLYSVDFGVYEMFLKYKSIHIMRAIEPALKIPFSLKTCSEEMNKGAYHRCEMSKLTSIGTKSQLAKLLLSQEELIQTDKIRYL